MSDRKGEAFAPTSFERPTCTAATIWPLYVLFFASGMTGLIFEVMWMRSFSLVFGSTTRAAAAVLASFFAGMAIGNALGGRLARPRGPALRRYGVAEIAVAIGALAVEAWLLLFHSIYPALYQSALGSGPGMPIVKGLLALVAMGPPCVAMGVTLPLMSRALVARTGHLGRRLGGIYALNTVGATAGVLLAGFVLPAWIGVRTTVYAAAAGNIIIGLAAVLVSRRQGLVLEAPEDDAAAGVPAARRRADRYVIFVAAVSGFGTLALEVLYTRLLANESDCSVFSFAVMLATFLVFLALGALIVSIWVDRLRRPWMFLACTQALAVATIMISPRVFYIVVAALPVGKSSTLVYALGGILAKAALIMGPTALLVGMALPTAWKIATRHAVELGQRVGGLTAFNTLAAVAGSLAAGFLIVPRLGLGPGFALVALLYAVLSMVAWSRVYDDHKRRDACVVVGVIWGGLYALHLWLVVPLIRDPQDRVLWYREGESATVAVLEQPTSVRYLAVNTHYLLGSTDEPAVATQKMQGRLPLRMHPQPDNVAFIGVATGISVSAALEYPVRRVVALELIPDVLAAARQFDAFNGRVLHDPRVVALVADGRNHLFATSEKFDVIIGDLFIPWEAGTGYLYTTEHFRNVARALNPGGLFAQWLPAYQLALGEVRTIAGTFSDVFPHAEFWLYDNGDRQLLALVGFAESRSGPRRMEPRSPADPVDWHNLTFICDGDRLRSWTRDTPRNTDQFPRIEFAAAASHIGRQRESTAQMIDAIRELRPAGALSR